MKTNKAVIFGEFKEYIPSELMANLTCGNIEKIAVMINVPVNYIYKRLAEKSIENGRKRIKANPKNQKLEMVFDAPTLFDFYWIWKEFYHLE